MKKIRNIVLGSIFVLPVLQYYKAPFLVDNLAFFIEIILVLLMITVFLSERFTLGKSSVSFYFLIAAIWSVGITMVSWLRTYSSDMRNMNILISFCMFAIMTFCMLHFEDLEAIKIIRFYGLLSKMFCTIAIVQYILYYTTGYVWVCKIPLFVLEDIYNPEVFGTITYTWTKISHLSGVFAEPAHLSLFVLPYLVFILFVLDISRRRRWAEAIFITVSIFLSTSGTGILAGAIIWLFFFLQKNYGKRNANQEWGMKILLVCMMALVAHVVLLQTSVNYAHLVRTLFVWQPGKQSKSGYRIYRGIDIYLQLSFFEKIFGIGYKNYNSFSDLYQIISVYDVEGVNKEYFSAIFQILIYFGMAGFAFWGKFFEKLLKRSGYEARVLIVVFFLLCIASSILMEITWQMFICSVCLINTYKKEGGMFIKNARNEDG